MGYLTFNFPSIDYFHSIDWFNHYRIHRSAGPAALVLELVHKTSLEEIPYAMCAFQGKVLIGVKNLLRLYDLGKKKLLRKSENKVQIYLDVISGVIYLVYFLIQIIKLIFAKYY